jgi:hypothetical protein
MPAQEILPSGIALNTTSQAIRDRLPSTLGQKSMANSLPVTFAFDQQALEVIGTIDIAGTVTVTGGLTDTQLRATPVPVSLASLPALATGSNVIGSISNTSFGISGTLPAFASTPTFNIGTAPTIAVTGTFWQATQPISASALPLPTGAATETTLSSINTKTPALGSAVSASSSPVVIASDQATVPVNQAGVTATGSLGALNATQALSLNGASGWAIDVRGTFVGTITFQGTIDGTNWFSISMLPAGGGVNVAAVTTTTAVGAWTGSANGMQQVRATFSAFTSGSATIVLRAMQAVGVVQNYPTGQTTQPVSGTVTATVANATVTSVTSGNLGIPGTIADVASAALTTTTTTGTLTPTFGCSYEVNIPVTVVSGTTPTLDVVVQESDDAGTNWFDVYHFPRITATGMYRSPKLPLVGNRVRYVQTVTGTTPSFTRAINRLQSSDSVTPIRQLIDRTISLTTLNASTTGLNVQGCRNAQLVINIGTATTPPALQLQGSDDNGATWYAIGSPLTAVASSTVQVTVNNVSPQLLRATVSTIGNTVVAGYVLVKGF